MCAQQTTICFVYLLFVFIFGHSFFSVLSVSRILSSIIKFCRHHLFKVLSKWKYVQMNPSGNFRLKKNWLKKIPLKHRKWNIDLINKRKKEQIQSRISPINNTQKKILFGIREANENSNTENSFKRCNISTCSSFHSLIAFCLLRALCQPVEKKASWEKSHPRNWQQHHQIA